MAEPCCIPGSLPLCPLQAELKAVRTAAHSTEVVDGFRVLHTANVGDTFRLYAQLHRRIEARWLAGSSPALPALLPAPHACKEAIW